MDRADILDWSSGKRLFRLRSAGAALSEAALARLDAILAKHPDWEFEASERAEFSIWSSSRSGEVGDPDSVRGVSVEHLLPVVREKAASDRFGFSGLWHNVTQKNPGLAFEALVSRASRQDVLADEWQQLFFKLREETSNRELDEQVLSFLSNQPLAQYRDAFDSISAWLKDKRTSLITSGQGWAQILSVWDAIASYLDNDTEKESPAEPGFEDAGDVMMAVWNETPGMLTELLAQHLVDLKPKRNSAPREDISQRLERAIQWPGRAGLVAQCALMQRLPWLDHFIPQWTWENLIPLLDAKRAYWRERWKARFYHTALGSERLFEATKASFLATFATLNGSEPGGGQTLLLVRAAYKATRPKSKWPFSSSEAREAVEAGGSALMREIARALEYREGETPPEKHWKTVVQPVVSFLWPRSASAQTDQTTRGLIRLMLSSGPSFPKAVEEFVPFVKPWSGDQPWDFEFVFNEEAMSLMAGHPGDALNFLDAYISGAAVPVKLNEILDRLQLADPEIAKERQFAILRGFARRSAA